MITTARFTKTVAGTAAAAFLFMAPAQAETYLTFEGTPSAKVPADSVSFNLSRSADYDLETGQLKQPATWSTGGGPLYINRTMDSASPIILDAVAKGKSIPSLEVHLSETGANGAAPSETVWSLKNAVFNNYNIYQGETGTVESFDLSYSDATMSFYGVDPKTGKKATTPTTSVTWQPGDTYMTMPVEAEH